MASHNGHNVVVLVMALNAMVTMWWSVVVVVVIVVVVMIR